MSAHFTRHGAPLQCRACGSFDLEPSEHHTTVLHPYTDLWGWMCAGCGTSRSRYGSKAQAVAAAAEHEAAHGRQLRLVAAAEAGRP